MPAKIIDKYIYIDGKNTEFLLDMFDDDIIDLSLSPNKQCLVAHQDHGYSCTIAIINLVHHKSHIVSCTSTKAKFTWSKDSRLLTFSYIIGDYLSFVKQILMVVNTNTLYGYTHFVDENSNATPKFIDGGKYIKFGRDKFIEPTGWITTELTRHIIPPLVNLVVDIMDKPS